MTAVADTREGQLWFWKRSELPFVQLVAYLLWEQGVCNNGGQSRKSRSSPPFQRHHNTGR
jgi:hypothetical protein